MNPFHKNARMRNSAKWRLSILTIALLLGAVAGTMTLQGQPNLNPHGAINLDCQLCHVTENWTKIRDDSQFDHSKTAFPLKGQHATVSCRSCHQSLEFKSADTRCAGCHQDIHANQFGDGCNRCHTPEMWVDEPQFKRMHQESRFPLVGAHSSVDCQLCHPGDRYANTPLDCYGCHLQTYAATTNPDHHGAGFSVNCGECHSMLVSSWVGNLAAFQHTPNFPLVGGHNINDCSTCHLPGSNYKQTTTTCFDCHQSAYETATPNHITGNFGTNCAVCHTIMGWSPAQFDHNITSFPLTGAHASVNCQACHSQGYAGTPTDCYSCHQSNFNGAANPIHTAPSFSYVCTLCHNTAGWSPSTFNHTIQTTYPLTGSHIATSCASCHPNGVYAGTSNLCWTCHQQDYINVQDPNHVANNYPHECEICHNTSSWGDAIFNHNQTNFPLTGAHTTVSCTQCHVNGVYSGTPTDCYSCHQTSFQGATNPIHTAPSFSYVCTVCHNTAGWSPSTFNHTIQTTYPLTGSHIATSCASCHPNGVYAGTSNLCYTCHQQDYNNVQDPNHVANNYPHECEICHNTSSWGDAIFNHNQTNFPLTGAHTTVSCTQCHVNGVYSGTPTDCYSCHQTSFQGATNPIHTAPSFSYVCTVCHNTAGWSPSSFNHTTQTTYPLTGSHIATSCASCHPNGVYAGTSNLCYTCHQQDYNNVQDPNHVANNYPHECEICHNTSSWGDAIFNHNQTNFPLTGAHTTVSCTQCHVNGVYSGTPTDCYSCHQTSFQGATNPIHTAPSFSYVCTVCHNTAGWSPSTFNHNTQTTYPLTGVHVTTSCASCHANGVYNGTPIDCYSCHQNNFQGATNPIHTAPSFNYVCTVCHNTAGWSPSTFNHNTQTTYPLTGVHVTVSCASCHANGVYNGTPTDCYSCHQTSFQGANNPIHTAPSFSYVCTVCHNTAGWSPSTFNHNTQTTYPLTGSHVTARCVDCHPGGQYSGTPTNCYFCHQGDFQGTTNPNHQQAMFPTQCQLCHSTVNWTNTTYNHDQQFFPIYSGSHQGEWNLCTDCHIGGNYLSFSCIDCHEHNNQPEVNQQHQGVPGYSYQSQACYNCHPTGGGGGLLGRQRGTDGQKKRKP